MNCSLLHLSVHEKVMTKGQTAFPLKAFQKVPLRGLSVQQLEKSADALSPSAPPVWPLSTRHNKTLPLVIHTNDNTSQTRASTELALRFMTAQTKFQGLSGVCDSINDGLLCGLMLCLVGQVAKKKPSH